MEGVGDLLAVLVFVIHDAFEPQARKVLKHEIVVLGDAAEERDVGLVHEAERPFQVKGQFRQMFHSQAAKTLLTKIRSGLKKEKLSSDTHFVSNSIKLVSIGGSISGTAVTHTCTRYFPLKSEGEPWVCFSVCVFQRVCDGLIAPCAHWPSDCEVT